MEPSWDLKISKYVDQYSYVCIKQILYKLYVTFSNEYMAGQTSRVLLAYLILCTNKPSLHYKYHTPCIMHAACHATTDLKLGSCIALLSSVTVTKASKFVIIEVESWSQTVSL